MLPRNVSEVPHKATWASQLLGACGDKANELTDDVSRKERRKDVLPGCVRNQIRFIETIATTSVALFMRSTKTYNKLLYIGSCKIYHFS